MDSQIRSRKRRTFSQAILFGLVFGFLLQKGGVAKYHVLEGQLLLTDFTVMKVMLSAIFVAMLGLHFLQKVSMVQFQIKPTKIASNVIGGLVFGVGFAWAGYCPGTGAAALGQGDLPAVIFMLGMIVGSYVFAEASGTLKRTIDNLGNKGKLFIHTALRINSGPSVALFAATILVILILLTGVRP